MKTDPHPQLDFTGLRVGITGGTSGLGLALVEQLSRLGARVAFVARTEDRVRDVAHRIAGSHGIVGDVSKKEQTYPIALQIKAALGGIDVLIHNASSLGPAPLALLADTDCEDLQEALDTNLLGPFRLTKAVLGSLVLSARDGRAPLVAHISSDAAETPYPGWGAYSASKAALCHLGRIWHEELRSVGVRVIDHDPGDMDTPLHLAAVPDADRAALKDPAESARQLIERIAELRRNAVLPTTSVASEPATPESATAAAAREVRHASC